MIAKHYSRLMRQVHQIVRFLAVPPDGGGRPANRSPMNNTQRLLLIAALITAELLCAQTDPTDAPAGPRPGGPGGPGRFHPVLRALDADQDGEISAAEIPNAAAALRTLDTNADGSLSAEELRPAHPGRRGAPPADAPMPPAGAPRGPGPHPRPADPVMLALDANGDGVLSAAEIDNAPASLKALDANGDGKLTRDELRPLPPVH